jgi:hypothetical protein
MKKLITALFILGLSVSFIACNSEIETTLENIVELEDDSQVFTVSAVSAASLLDFSNISTLSYVPLSETTEEEIGGDELITEEIDELDRYLEMMDTYLGDNDTLSVTVMESDIEDYEFLISFSTVDISGNEVEYFLYYNETFYVDDVDEEPVTTEEPLTTEEPVTTEEPATTEEVTSEETTTLSQGTKNFNFQDEDDEFVEYSLEGIIIYGDIEYSVEGKKVVHENGVENTILRAWVDQDNFVKVSYKTDSEDGNTKFFYEVKEDGVIITKSRVQVVEQEGAKVVHLDFQDEIEKAKYIFKIIEEEGVTLIHVKYDIRLLADDSRETGNIHIQISEDSETGELIYTYKILAKGGSGNGNKYSKEIEKNHQKGNSANENSKNKGSM